MSLRRRNRGRSEGAKANIDMTSLIDLTFLLLVTFILTIPALEQGISIMLPRAKTDTLPNKNNKANTITVSQTGTFMNNTPVTLEALEQDLLAKVKELTGGESFETNVQLALNNARCAARIAAALCELKKAE